MRSIIRIQICLTIIIILSLGLCSCGKNKTDKSGISVYYLGKADHALKEQQYKPKADSKEQIIEELIAKLSIQPTEMALTGPISGFRLISSETLGKIVTMNFSGEYYELDAVTEVLTRTAIVNTMCSFSEVDGVYFTVDGEPFRDADGEEPGIMEPDQFIYNSNTEMRNYERVKLHLYFADKSGEKLVDAFRNVVYNSNMPLERIVLEQVIQGPNGSFAYPAVNSETRVINVTVRDGICYANLSSEFLTDSNGVTPQTTIYSIVNSLCELPSVEAVQISVDGQTDITFRETISLTGNFRMNPGIVEGQPEKDSDNK